MNNVTVPSKDTTYYCKLFKVPHFNDTQHIVKYSTIVEKGNEAIVHHIVVYDCPEYIATDPNHVVFEGDCNDYSINMPSRECTRFRILYGWAVGGNDIYLPTVAGMPLSGDSDIHYILIEMHYDVKYNYYMDMCTYTIYFTRQQQFSHKYTESVRKRRYY